MKKHSLLILLFILPFFTHANEDTCYLVGSFSESALKAKTNKISEKIFLKDALQKLEAYKGDFTHNEFRKMRLQIESVINKTYNDKTKQKLSDFDFSMYGVHWRLKCEKNQIRIY